MTEASAEAEGAWLPAGWLNSTSSTSNTSALHGFLTG